MNIKEKQELNFIFKRIQSLLTIGKEKHNFFQKEDVFSLLSEQIDKLKTTIDATSKKQCIGYDKKGKELYLGDKCSFIINVSTWEDHRKKDLNFVDVNRTALAVFEGTISYDDSWYGYCLDTENEYMPSILMSCLEFGAITKIDELTKAPATSELEEDLQR